MASTEQKVLRQHHANQASARDFIDQWQVPATNDNPIDMNSMITYAVSTTSGSSLLLIAKGIGSVFTRDTYSADPENPWLIFQHGEENQTLAQHVQERWDNMAVHQNGNRVEVNKIAAHVLYQRQNGKWVLVPAQCDSSNNVRFKVNDIEIWSHPPRDEPLMTVLRENEIFRRAEGDLKQSGKALNGIKRDTKIPPDKKQQAVKSKLDAIKQKFLQIYGLYEGFKPLPDSYQWPTLQLGQRTSTTGDGTELQRYGGTFAGVYGSFANPVHHIFPAPHVQLPRGLPTQETVFYNLLPQDQFGLSFEEVITPQ